MTSGVLSLSRANGLAMEDKKVFVDVGMIVFEALLLSLVRFVALIL